MICQLPTIKARGSHHRKVKWVSWCNNTFTCNVPKEAFILQKQYSRFSSVQNLKWLSTYIHHSSWTETFSSRKLFMCCWQRGKQTTMGYLPEYDLYHYWKLKIWYWINLWKINFRVDLEKIDFLLLLYLFPCATNILFLLTLLSSLSINYLCT